MAEYIEREAVEKFIENGLNNPDKKKAFGHDAIEIMAEVHYMPAADVAPVVHGKWLDEDFPEKTATVHGFAICSVCGELSHKAEHGYITFFQSTARTAAQIWTEDKMRLIDTDSLGVGRCNPDIMRDRAYAAGWNGLLNIVNDAETVDAVLVVRCKECKHFNLQTHECENELLSTDHEGGASYSLNFYDDDFCSYGEKKNE